MNLNLDRPIIFFDLETTGTDILKDRIVEISLIKVNPDGSEFERTAQGKIDFYRPSDALFAGRH